ncbi:MULTISPECIES: nickel-dependent lactate racemase [Desulfosediminicola]|uniref:nickel-dependent lactate racemase n=1 Tax=Desulfosediminicola TaxID=2886823 RepID=UPI0010AB82A3|nr:nickel-dependent lactate racemase [Desulfosediminicola ganghwensis]
MKLELKYGEGFVEVRIPDTAEIHVLEPKKIAPVQSVTDSLKHALLEPEKGDAEFFSGLEKSRTVAIAVPDEARPLPLKTVLPQLLKWLFAKAPDLNPEQVIIVIGGVQPLQGSETPEQLISVEMACGCRVITHDATSSPIVSYGYTKRGTPVHINALFASADYKIVVGQIDPHQFVGFTGAAKGAVIGCGGEATRAHNHSLMFDEQVNVGVLDGNPVHEDLAEAGEMVGIDLAVNFILSPEREVVTVLAGEPDKTLKAGAKVCAEVYGVGIKDKFDIVIASCGGYPRDICLCQAQKGLNLASRAVKEGGNILLLAKSSQGIGDDIFFDYVSQDTTPEEILAAFKMQGRNMGAHTAYVFGRTLNQFDVAITSELDPAILQKCHLRAAAPTGVIQEWVDGFPGTPKVGVILDANTLYFYDQ